MIICKRIHTYIIMIQKSNIKHTLIKLNTIFQINVSSISCHYY